LTPLRFGVYRHPNAANFAFDPSFAGPRQGLDWPRMEGFWPIFYLAIILKIPVAAMLWLVWWAARAEPETEDLPGEDSGFRRWHKPPRRPRGPRRGGPHMPAERPLPACPPGGRLRVLTPPAPVRAAANHRAAEPERGVAAS
jgi:hypothetical protein